ncbi:MAG: bifunctional diguanylate cyclase/phosphodiesterase, partial [Alphaproteobacteria bacterium]|nr:bifunctional diguanylate cyclase/phosphodiesterase [Alphaproteobacteria bacterium]
YLPLHKELMAEVLSSNYTVFENRHLKRKDGKIIPIDFTTLHSEANGRHVIQGIVRDKSELRAMEEELEVVVQTDALTGLLTRSALAEELGRTFQSYRENGKKFAYFTVDIDHQKEINDAFGRAVGDQAIKEVANRLRSRLPEAIIGRTGGDEFGIICLTCTTASSVKMVGETLLEVFKRGITLDKTIYHLSVSIGGTLVRERTKDVDELVGEADAAVLESKTNIRGQFVLYKKGMLGKIQERAGIRDDLARAVEEDEFVPHFQPILNLSTGKLVGLEALIRWQHPKMGLMSPGGFIDIAEDTKLIIPMGLSMLEKAATQLCRWRRSRKIDRDVRLSINLAPTQFRSETLEQDLIGILEKTGFPANRLELEITERLLELDFGDLDQRLSRLRKAGIAIVMDDFGTGFASFHNLSRMPLDKLKIPREFVRDFTDNRAHREIVRAIATMAKTLEIDAIIEGIETEEQNSLAQQLGCRFGQGFLFCKPKSSRDMSSWLKSEK